MSNLERVAAAATELVGLNARTNAAAYARAVGPGESAQMQRDMLRMNGCGLVAAAALRGGGYAGPELRPPYRIGSAISRMVQLARAHGAWRTDAPAVRGAIPVMGGAGLGGPEHMQIVVGARSTAPGVVTLDVVEGGQVDGTGAECVKRQTHTARTTGPRTVIGARTMLGWIDPSRLPFTAEPSGPGVGSGGAVVAGLFLLAWLYG